MRGPHPIRGKPADPLLEQCSRWLRRGKERRLGRYPAQTGREAGQMVMTAAAVFIFIGMRAAMLGRMRRIGLVVIMMVVMAHRHRRRQMLDLMGFPCSRWRCEKQSRKGEADEGLEDPEGALHQPRLDPGTTNRNAANGTAGMQHAA